MPKAMRFSPAYERRRSLQYSARSNSMSNSDSPSSSPPNDRVSTKKTSHSTAYLRGRISSGLQSSPVVSPPIGIANESYLRVKKKGALTTWSTRYLVLRGAQLVWFSNKQDAQWRRGVQEIFYIESGKITTLRSGELGLEIITTDKKEYVARAFDRGDLARWITAFQRLAIKRETKRMTGARLSETLTADSTATGLSEPEQESILKRAEFVPVEKQQPTEGRHVSFHSSVLVRMIPSVTDDQISELYYSREEMEKFSARASSILCRTEEAVSCAYLAIRRPSSISCKGELSLCRREVS